MTTPRERLATLRAELSRVLRRALDRHDVSQAALAHGCGSTPQKVQLWCDHERAEGPSVAHLPLMPKSVAADLCDWALRGHGLHVVELPQAGAEQTPIAHLHAVLSECGDVPREYALALSDGVVTRAEKAKVRAEIAEALKALASLDAQLVAEGEHEARMTRGGRA